LANQTVGGVGRWTILANQTRFDRAEVRWMSLTVLVHCRV